MPISPEDAAKHETNEEKLCLEVLVKHIDAELLKSYQGHAIVVKLPKTLGLTRRAKTRLREMYLKAGWKQVYVEDSDIKLDAAEAVYFDYRD